MSVPFLPQRCHALIISILALVVTGSTFAQTTPEDPRSLVVKIHTTHRFPDVFRPWTHRDPAKATGSGTILTGGRILTNAHVVRNASEIYVQPYQSSELLEARVVGFAPRIDLAVLELQDPTPFAETTGLTISDAIPAIRDTVNVFGFPTGGDELSVTEGIVSRVEFTAYRFQGLGLRIQVDAALNPGNSGGPAVANGEIIGLVFSGIPKSQSIGYLIPGEEINLFLQDIADGTYDGKSLFLDTAQTVQNETLRRRLGLDSATGGIMIIDPYREDPDYPLRRWDVITHIGEHALDRQGNVLIGENTRLNARYLLQHDTKDDLVPCTILRDGHSMSVKVPVARRKDRVIDNLFEANPDYFIYGPLVFSAATQDHLGRVNEKSLASLGTSNHPLVSRANDRPDFPGEEIVLITTKPFPHSLMKGYSSHFMAPVKSINGTEVKNLAHLVEILRDNREAEVEFVFEPVAHMTPEILVFNHQAMLDATEEILNDNGIRHPYSPAIRDVWEKR